MSDKKQIANVFVVNQEKLFEAVKLSLSTIAELSPKATEEWIKEYILKVKQLGCALLGGEGNKLGWYWVMEHPNDTVPSGNWYCKDHSVRCQACRKKEPWMEE